MLKLIKRNLNKSTSLASVDSTIFSILLGLIFIFSLATVFYKELSLAVFIIILIVILDKLGKGIILRELIAFIRPLYV